MRKKIALGLILAALISTAAIAGEKGADYTIRDKNYVTKGYVKNGKIYDRDYHLEGYISRDKVYDRNYRKEGYLDRGNRGRGGSGKSR